MEGLEPTTPDYKSRALANWAMEATWLFAAKFSA